MLRRLSKWRPRPFRPEGQDRTKWGFLCNRATPAARDADVVVGRRRVRASLGRESGISATRISETTCDAASLARRLYKTQIVGTYRAGAPFGEFDAIECGDIRRAGIGLDGSDDPSRRVQRSGVAARGSSLPGGRPQLSSAGFGAPR